MLFIQPRLVHKQRRNGSRVTLKSELFSEPIPDEQSAPKLETHSLVRFIRSLCGILVNDTRFRSLISALIVANAIAMGVATYPFVRENPIAVSRMEKMDMIFLIIYTIELGMQFIYRGFKLFLDGWQLFDFLIIIVSWAFNKMSIIRSFRILRVVRLIGRFTILKQVVESLIVVIPKLYYICLLLLLIFYVFTVLFTEFFKKMHVEGHTEEDYFSRLDITAFTLFQMMSLDDWSDITRELAAKYWYASLLVIVFLLFTTFSILNMFIAVFCQAVHELEEIRLEAKAKKGRRDENTMEDEHDDTIQTLWDHQDELAEQMASIISLQEKSIQKLNSLSLHVDKLKNGVNCSDDMDIDDNSNSDQSCTDNNNNSDGLPCLRAGKKCLLK